MQVHPVEKIKELKKLRKRGYSINELVAKLSIPKTTAWYHIHNVSVLPKYVPLKVFNIQEKDIIPTLRIFSGMNRSKCLNYWSKITKISKHRFIIRLNDGGTRGKTKYGMCRITIKKGGNFLKLIQSLISQFYEEKITKY